MKKYLILILINIIANLSYSQNNIPTKRQIKKAKSDTVIDALAILLKYQEFKFIAIYDYKKHKYSIDSTSKKIQIKDSTTVNYITENDKLVVLQKDLIEITYGGSGPEKQKFKIIGWVNNYIIIETRYENKGWLNGKLVYREKFHKRLAWAPI